MFHSFVLAKFCLKVGDCFDFSGAFSILFGVSILVSICACSVTRYMYRHTDAKFRACQKFFNLTIEILIVHDGCLQTKVLTMGTERFMFFIKVMFFAKRFKVPLAL